MLVIRVDVYRSFTRVVQKCKCVTLHNYLPRHGNWTSDFLVTAKSRFFEPQGKRNAEVPTAGVATLHRKLLLFHYCSSCYCFWARSKVSVVSSIVPLKSIGPFMLDIIRELLHKATKLV